MPILTLYIPDPQLHNLLNEAIRPYDVAMVDNQDQADITITAPIRLGTVLDQIEAAIAKKQSRPTQAISLSKTVTLDAIQRKLVLDTGAEITLTDTETDIILALYNTDEAIHRTDLMTDILGYHVEAETHTVETHIYRLRQKLDPHNDTRDLIITDTHGYRLNG